MILRFVLKWAVIFIVAMMIWSSLTGSVRQAYWWMYP
jgi:hypothetical protein